MKNRLILHTIIGLSMIAAWTFLIYMPLSNKQGSIDRRITDAERTLSDLRESVALLPIFLETQNQLEANREQLNERLFGKSEILELFREIGFMAEDHNLRLIEVSPPLLELLQLEQRVVDTSNAPFLTLRLTLEGEYTNFGRFVVELEQTDFYRTPKRCEIDGPRDAGRPTLFMLDFTALLGTSRDIS